jgi:hypothetical protein
VAPSHNASHIALAPSCARLWRKPLRKGAASLPLQQRPWRRQPSKVCRGLLCSTSASRATIDTLYTCSLSRTRAKPRSAKPPCDAKP